MVERFEFFAHHGFKKSGIDTLPDPCMQGWGRTVGSQSKAGKPGQRLLE